MDEILKYSNPLKAQENAIKYLGKDALLYLSKRKDKKYMIQDPNGKWVHFGQLSPPYSDFTRHQNEQRRQHYLKRSNLIKGNWRNNKFSPNNLSRNILWV